MEFRPSSPEFRGWFDISTEHQHHIFLVHSFTSLPQNTTTTKMAIISANTMIRSLALFHLTLAALLVKNPKLIANQSVIMILGGSMQLVCSLWEGYIQYANC
jgi:hypothetical protein